MLVVTFCVRFGLLGYWWLCGRIAFGFAYLFGFKVWLLLIYLVLLVGCFYFVVVGFVGFAVWSWLFKLFRFYLAGWVLVDLAGWIDLVACLVGCLLTGLSFWLLFVVF